MTVDRLRAGMEVGGAPLPAAVAQPRIFLIAEEVGGHPDEGHRNFTRGLAEALGRRAAVRVYTAGGEGDASMHHLRHKRLLVSWALWRALRRERPAAVLYVSKSSATLAALLRAWVLKRMTPAAPVIMVTLQPRRLGGLAARLATRLWPDLLLVMSESERQQAVSLGANAARVESGVDLVRFRPPGPGEKARLRRKWGVPADTQVVLHVGHLNEGRNLQALLPLAAQPGVTVIVVASTQREHYSPALRQDLAGRVLLVEGLRPVEEFYRMADCYAFPVSSPEWVIGLPLSILEALASDLPVASVPFGPVQERFSHTEGVFFAETPATLPAAVERALQDKVSTRQLAEPYSWDALAENVLTWCLGSGSRELGMFAAGRGAHSDADGAHGPQGQETELRIRGMTAADVPAVVELHMLTLPHLPVTRLGPAFLKHFYKQTVAASQISLVATLGAQVVGFVMGSAEPGRFFARLLLRRGVGMALAAAPRAALHPRMLVGMAGGLLKPAKAHRPPGTATMMFLSVAKGARRLGAGRALVEAFDGEAAQRGAARVDLTTDQLEDGVNAFYQRLGFRLNGESRRSNGTRRNDYVRPCSRPSGLAPTDEMTAGSQTSAARSAPPTPRQRLSPPQ